MGDPCDYCGRYLDLCTAECDCPSCEDERALDEDSDMYDDQGD